MKRTALSAFSLLALLAPACAAVSSGESVDSTQERALGAVNTRWPTQAVTVCWVTTSSTDPQFAQKQQAVQTAVTAAYGDPTGANVTFTGWAPCASTPGTDRIEITVADAPPLTGLGRMQPTPMTLNFTMTPYKAGPTAARAHCNDTSIDQSTGESRLMGCIKTVAVHEFGHALGLLHEEARSDASFNCGDLGERSFDDFDVDLGTIDPGSIMNHCNPVLLGVPSFPVHPGLSTRDVAGIQFLFGHANAAAPVTVSFGTTLFPWYFLHANASGVAEVAPIEGPLGPDALLNVVPALNGVSTMVSFQSSATPSEYLCNDNPFNPVHLVAGCDPSLSSWKIDTTTDIAPGDSGFRFVLPSGRAMNIGPSPANLVYTTLPSQAPNPQELVFIPRVQVPERMLRSTLTSENLNAPFFTGHYLAHSNGALVMEQLPSARPSDGYWELVAGLDNPQLVSIRFTDAAMNQSFIMEQGGHAVFAPAATAKASPSRATFTRQRIAQDNRFFAQYRFVEELGGNLALCQLASGVVDLCSLATDNTFDSVFQQTLPMSTAIAGVSNGVDYCSEAAAACAAGDQAPYDSLSASCQQSGGTAPPCYFETCPKMTHWCPPATRAGVCYPGYCLSAMAMCMGGSPCSYAASGTPSP